jgi:hypothetical protein
MSDNLFIRIYDTRESIIIHHYVVDQVVSLDKTYMRISRQNAETLSQKNIESVYKAAGILGIIQIGILDYLLYIKDSRKVGNIGNTEIFEITEVDFVLISFDHDGISKEVSCIIDGLRHMFKQGYYYSSNYDLTNSLQAQKSIKVANTGAYDIIRDANPAYLWNYEMLNRFVEYQGFITNCICGYVNIHTEQIDSRSFSYILISRRSHMNAGTYNNKRGIDETGNVANFVETEQIVILDNNVFSFVQLRGTSPLYYSNKKEIQRPEYLPMAFNKHVQELAKSYKLVFFINLMNCLKENEQILTEKFESLIKENEYKNVKYSFFDIDNEIKDFDQENENLEKFLNGVENIFQIFKFFGIFTMGENKFHSEQIGVIRTNCYDGLMRSNYVQMKIGWRMLAIQLQNLGIDVADFFHTSGDNLIANVDDINIFENIIAGINLNDTHLRQKSSFPSVFKQIWIENNKYIATHYKGDEKETVSDSLRQKCVEVMLHKTSLNQYSSKYNHITL